MSENAAADSTPAYQSYLNNDGIDQLQPAERKHRVSSLSLSDLNQWQTGLTKLNSSGNLNKSSSSLKKIDSLAKLSRNSSVIRRRKRSIIDHDRVASYAFCFDIDGVILRGPNTIPEAVEAIRILNGDNKYHVKVPFVFVTNGGGKPEAVRAADLSKRLETHINTDQIIQGHTPMKDLVGVYESVLVVGGVENVCRNVATSYGFKQVYTPLDILKWNSAVTPYHDMTELERKCARDVDFSKTPIDAILVFADSRNWAADQQIILELLLSKGGVMGTESKTFDEGPAIYFAHSDFIWATNYKLSRYGMGALQVSIAALYREHTGKELKVNRFGKPQKGTFKFANKVLSSWRQGVLDDHIKKLSINDPNADDADILINEEGEEIVNQSKLENYHDADESDDDVTERLAVMDKQEQITLQLPPASTVYFVGDTPESDIRFANSHDVSWHSILVKTGVYQAGTEPKYKPKHLCENVLEAVNYAIEREHELELTEWNETAKEEEAAAAAASNDNSRINFADLVMTPSNKNKSAKEQPKESAKQEKPAEGLALEEVEIPDLLNAEINKVKGVQVDKKV